MFAGEITFINHSNTTHTSKHRAAGKETTVIELQSWRVDQDDSIRKIQCTTKNHISKTTQVRVDKVKTVPSQVPQQ